MDMQADQSPAARMWGSTGPAYDGISFGLSDTISHAVQMLWPRTGEAILDIGTGTGWAARLAAQRGADVTGIDISEGMLAAAEALSSDSAVRPTYLRAPAEALPFSNGSIDGIVSTYGVIFANDPSAAISEMARVLKSGGRVALATWEDVSDGYIPRFFRLIASFSDVPPPPSSPFNWGRHDWLEENFKSAFKIGCHRQTTMLYAPNAETVWEEYLKGFGPVAATHAALDDKGRQAFRDAFIDMHQAFRTETGLVIPRQALLVRGVRH